MDNGINHKIAIILLAAGSSSRMGKSKQLLAIDGETLLEKSVKTAIHANTENTIVVLGANDAEHRAGIKNFPVSIVCNPRWATGMGSSLKVGLAFLQSMETDPEAVIVMVCDQPLLTSSHLNKLMERYDTTRKPIIASLYSGTMGVPALFDTTMFAKLIALDDHQGAKKIINSSKEFVDAIDFPEGSIDLDTPEDVEQFLR